LTYPIAFASWSGAAYGSISLLNVLADLISKRGVNDQVVGVVGGFLFWIGVDTLSLIIYPLAIEQLTMEFLRIEVLGIGAVLSVVGLALMVKG